MSSDFITSLWVSSAGFGLGSFVGARGSDLVSSWGVVITSVGLLKELRLV